MSDQRINILLIEDNPGDALLIKTFLNSQSIMDFSLEHVERLEQALLKIDDSNFHLILLDLNLPDCYGLESLQRVTIHNDDIPVIILSGLSNRETAIEAVRNGAQDYLVKGSFNDTLLLRSIAYAIERKKIVAELLKTKDKLSVALEQLRLEQARRVESEKLKSVKELSGAIAHEFSQPLQVLSGIFYMGSKMEEKHFATGRKMIDRIKELQGNLSKVTSLKTKPYLNTSILDIDNCANHKAHSAKSILIVDDDQDIGDMMTSIFSEAGYHVENARSGNLALKKTTSQCFDLIISDLQMPGMSGISLYNELKIRNYDGHFILLTGYDVTDQMKSGMYDFEAVFKKPVDLKLLLNRVEKTLFKQKCDTQNNVHNRVVNRN